MMLSEPRKRKAVLCLTYHKLIKRLFCQHKSQERLSDKHLRGFSRYWETGRVFTLWIWGGDTMRN